MYKVIMAPTEGSDVEKGALSVAVKLAQRFGADLHLVRVLSAPLVIEMVPRPPVLEITEQTLRDERRARLHKLEALGNELLAVGDIQITTALKDGPIAPTLRDYAQESNVDLIVMSSHSRGGLKRVTLGSVTDFLIRNTHIPVLVVKPPAAFIGAAPEETLARIVVPLDGSAMAEQILPEVAALALGLNATVHLLHVLTTQTYSQEQIIEPGFPLLETAIAGADAYLSGPAGYLAKEGVKANKEVILGESVATAILDYAARIEANLIAIATRGSGGMTRFVFGTVSDEVTRKSPTSLLVFHPTLDGVKNKNTGQTSGAVL